MAVSGRTPVEAHLTSVPTAQAGHYLSQKGLLGPQATRSLSLSSVLSGSGTSPGDIWLVSGPVLTA